MNRNSPPSGLSGALLFALGFGAVALIFSLVAMFGTGLVLALLGMPLPPTIALALSVAGPTLAALLWRRSTGKRFAPVASGTAAEWFALLLLVPAYAGVAILAAMSTDGTYVLASPMQILAAFATQLLIVSLLEEIGWRGFLAPALLRSVSPFASALIVAGVWFAWHLPKFSVGPLYVGLLALSCVGVSILAMSLLPRLGLAACVVLHGCANASLVWFDLDQTDASVQYATYAATGVFSLLLAVAAMAVDRRWFFAEPAR